MFLLFQAVSYISLQKKRELSEKTRCFQIDKMGGMVRQYLTRHVIFVLKRVTFLFAAAFFQMHKS